MMTVHELPLPVTGGVSCLLEAGGLVREFQEVVRPSPTRQGRKETGTIIDKYISKSGH